MKKATWITGLKRRLIPLALLIALAGLFVIASPVSAAPMISLNPGIGAEGSLVTLTATMFESYKGDQLHIFFGGQQVAGSPVTVPDTGTFTHSFGIPAGTQPGAYAVHVKLTPDATWLVAATSFTVEATSLTIDIPSGQVGTRVKLEGKGFFANSPVWISYHNPMAAQTGTVTASTNGRFTYNLTIPEGVAGRHTISATNSANNYAETAFTVTPRITLSADAGGPGELVTISGNGFAFRSNVIIRIGATSVTTAKANDLGSFSLNFNVPDIPSNTYDLTAQDEAGNRDLSRFTVTAGARLSATEGGVGRNLTVTGSGFADGGTVTIDFGVMRVATLTADNDGGFSSTFAVPAVGAGNHTVTISDGVTTRKFMYTIESIPPDAPDLLLPLNDTATRVMTGFEWDEVTDESLPVTYRLQVASDANFSSLVLDKQGLAETEYSLTAGEALTVTGAATTYYWRARAVDGAGNTGNWSETRTFQVTAPTVPEPAPAATPNEKGEPFIELQKDETLTLDWSSASSPVGPVFYTVELSSDADFREVLIARQGLTVSNYALTLEEMELLKNNTSYYWRVKASDADGIDGGWSASDRFMLGSTFTWPGWATWLLVGLGVFILASAAFLLGKRRGHDEVLD